MDFVSCTQLERACVCAVWECWLVFNASAGSYDDVNDEVSELGFFR